MEDKQGRRKPNGKTTRPRRARLLERGAKRAERIHRAIAGFPLDMLARIGRLEKPVNRVRKLQDKSITATYEMVRGINRELDLLARANSSTRKAAAKKQPTRKAQTARTERTAKPLAAAS